MIVSNPISPLSIYHFILQKKYTCDIVSQLEFMRGFLTSHFYILIMNYEISTFKNINIMDLNVIVSNPISPLSIYHFILQKKYTCDIVSQLDIYKLLTHFIINVLKTHYYRYYVYLTIFNSNPYIIVYLSNLSMEISNTIYTLNNLQCSLLVSQIYTPYSLTHFYNTECSQLHFILIKSTF